MGVTSYYSFGGEILGEETGGVRRDYLTDALGSVTATVTSAGAVENTYRYKPYGETLAKTGNGSDPKFLWNGKWGYRNNLTPNMYIRNREYYTSEGRWLTTDKLREKGTLNKYLYCDSEPIRFIDYAGMQKIKVEGNNKYIPYDPNDRIKKIFNMKCNYPNTYGNTGCDPFTGRRVSVICDKALIQPCKLATCTERHEAIHRNQGVSCCSQVAKCYNDSKKTPKQKSDCITAYINWETAMLESWECPAWQETVQCVSELITGSDPKCCSILVRNNDINKIEMKNYCAKPKQNIPCPI